ncbi:MAG: diguanylate cyclase [Magnetococcales bacterium]|nr:diguanylate cyclase [Magnetococcales bacterium]
MRVLLVDDSPDDLLLLQTMLKSGGHEELTPAPSGEAALSWLRLQQEENLPDLILLDMQMPGMDGLTVLRRLKGEEALWAIPVIMVTGNTAVEDLAQALEAGAVDYITKPLRKVELLARIRVAERLEQALRNVKERERELLAMTDSLTEGVVKVDGRNRVRFLNPAAEALLEASEHEVIDWDFDHLIRAALPSEPDVTIKLLDGILKGDSDKLSGEYLLRSRFGRTFPVALRAGAIRVEGRPEGCVVSFEDIGERWVEEERRRLAARIVETSQEGICIVGPDRLIQDVNPAYERLTGYSPQDVVGNSAFFLAQADNDSCFFHEIWADVARKDRWQGEMWARRSSGVVFPLGVSLSAIRDPLGSITHYVVMMEDITDRRQYEDQLKHRANHDLLTGLPNRMLLADRLQLAMATALRNRQQLAFLFIDLDHFKPINDTLGHEVGDVVLATVARRLQAMLRKSDTAARLGGDEFAVIISEVADLHSVCAVADKIIQAISQEIDVGPHRCQVGASIGISLFPLGERNPANPALGREGDVLMNQADCAMYQAKRSGRNRHFLFRTEPVPPLLQSEGSK